MAAWFESSMKTIVIVMLTFVAMVTQSATLPKGKERLRELAVAPQLTMSFGINIRSSTFMEDLTEEGTIADWKERAQAKLREEPENLQVQLQLGRLLRADGDTNAARACYEKVAQTGRRRAEQRPNDGLNLTWLAEAVSEIGERDEAESLYRRATAVASNNWRCWIELGKFLDDCSFNAMSSEHPSRASQPTTLMERWLKFPPPADNLEQAIKRRNEASVSFQRAYEIAPNEFEVLIMRGRHLSFSNWTATMIQHFQGAKPLLAENLAFNVYDLLFSVAARPDYHRAAELRPRQYKLLTAMIYAEWVFAMRAATHFKSIQRLTLDQLPEKSRQVILNLMQRLNALADDPERKVAAGALTSFCALKMMFGDDGNRTAEVRRAVELNPDNEQAWDMLIGFALQTEAPEKFLELCERRLQHKKSARNHLIVAKALNVQKRFPEAEQQARASLKLDQNYAPASLMLAALAIRQDLPAAATAFLLQTRKAIDQLTDEDEANQRKREAFLNLAIVFALQDEPMKAREILESLLQRDETDQTARAIMTALP